MIKIMTCNICGVSDRPNESHCHGLSSSSPKIDWVSIWEALKYHDIDPSTCSLIMELVDKQIETGSQPGEKGK